MDKIQFETNWDQENGCWIVKTCHGEIELGRRAFPTIDAAQGHIAAVSDALQIMKFLEGLKK